MSNMEVMDRGITCLIQGLGAFEAERFISILVQEKFDYTKWQRDKFDSISSDDFYNAAIEYNNKNPFDT